MKGGLQVSLAQGRLHRFARGTRQAAGEAHPEVGEKADRDVRARDLLVPVGAHGATLELLHAQQVRLHDVGAVELVALELGDEREVAAQRDVAHAREGILVGDARRVRRRVAERLEERHMQCGALTEEVLDRRCQLGQIDAEGGDSGVPRGEGGSLSARAGTSKPRCHPLSLSDARDRPSSRRLNWCHSSI